MQARSETLVRPWMRRLSVLVLTAALASCGDSDPVDTGPTPSSVAASAGDGQTGTVGQLLGTALAVVVTGSDGQPYQGASVSWQVASGGGTMSPASSQSDAQGQATTQWTLGTGTGAQTLTATVEGLPAVTFTATATPDAPAQVVVTPASATIDALQGTAQLAAELQDQFGNTISGATFTWSSADEAVVTVDASGLATGLTVGSAEVSAEADGEGVSGSASVEVRQVAASVSISPADPQVTVGGTLQLTADVMDANDNAIPDPDVTWSSADESIATVDADGVLQGVAEGSVEITATSDAASGTTTAGVILDADDFEPTTDQEIGGAMTVGKLTVPAGVTLTVTSDLTLSALDDIDVQGAIVGDCVAIRVEGRGAATYSGTVDNACAAEGDDPPPALELINDGALTVDGATFVYSGDVQIKNNPTVTADDFSDLEGAPARSAGRGAAGPQRAPGGGPCIVIGGSFAPSSPAAKGGAEGTSAGGDGGDAGNVRLTCDGDLQMSGGSSVEGRSGGEGGDGMDADPTSDDAGNRGGNGGNGGDVDVRATGDITFEDDGGGTTLTLTNGGNGGDATVLGKDPGGSATATGGDGGDGGNTHVAAGGSITIVPGGLTIVVGKGGDGGEAIANGGIGKDADDTEAGPGGNATATGGAGGHSVNGTLRARGAVNGRGNIVVTGGDGGRGGDATAVGGRGGHGNLEFPDGADGGAMQAEGGMGGEARAKDITGTTVGTSGDGGDIRVVGGHGGDGADRCSIPAEGGFGGKGGTASGAPGEGGGGDNPGDKGEITVAENTGNGGDGMNGNGPGGGGTAGSDLLASGYDRTDEGLFTFQNGLDGEECPVPTTKAKIRLGTLENTGGNVPFGTQTLPLEDPETNEQIGTVPLTTVGEEGNHYFGSDPDRVGVSGGNGWRIELVQLELEGVAEPLAVGASVCLTNTFGVSSSNPVTITQRDADENVLATTEIGDPAANGGCTDLSVDAQAIALIFEAPPGAVIDMYNFLLDVAEGGTP